MMVVVGIGVFFLFFVLMNKHSNDFKILTLTHTHTHTHTTKTVNTFNVPITPDQFVFHVTDSRNRHVLKQARNCLTGSEKPILRWLIDIAYLMHHSFSPTRNG